MSPASLLGALPTKRVSSQCFQLIAVQEKGDTEPVAPRPALREGETTMPQNAFKNLLSSLQQGSRPLPGKMN